MNTAKLLAACLSFFRKRNRAWTEDLSVLKSLKHRISELEAQNQRLQDRNKALLMLLDNTSRKLSAYDAATGRQPGR